MKYLLSKRLIFAAIGFAVVLVSSPPALADGCGTLLIYGLCPNNCNQAGCAADCAAITPGPCEAAPDGQHSCNGSSCTCRCTNSEID